MSRYRRSNAAGATFFFTVVTYRRQRILTDDALRHALHEAIVWVRERHPFAVDAWVLRPDHLHCLWTLPPGDADFGRRWGEIKRRVTRAVAADYERADWRNASRLARRESTLWQRRFWGHQIRDDADYATHGLHSLQSGETRVGRCRGGLAVFNVPPARECGRLSGGLGGAGV